MEENDYSLADEELQRPSKEELETPAEDEEKKPKYEIPYELELEFPVELTANKTVEKIVFHRRIRGAYMEHLPVDTGKGTNMKLGHFFPIIAGMTGENMTLLRKLDRNDLLKCVEVVSSFF